VPVVFVAACKLPTPFAEFTMHGFLEQATGREHVVLSLGDVADGAPVLGRVHFADPCDPFLLGQRALAVATSDLAAMGATPLAFTLALTLPTVEADWLAAFARGLNLMAQGCDLRLIGGDTTRGPLCLTLTVFGRVPNGQALSRSGARPGDLLCVGGELGNAAGALPLVLGQRSAAPAIAEPLLAHYWSPQPQLALSWTRLNWRFCACLPGN